MNKRLLVDVLTRWVERHYAEGLGSIQAGYLYVIPGSKRVFVLRTIPGHDSIAVVYPDMTMPQYMLDKFAEKLGVGE